MATHNQQIALDDLISLPYTPALLLDARLNASITDDPNFRDACEWGFNLYLEEIEYCDRGLCTTSDEAKAFVRRDMLAAPHPLTGPVPLTGRVGVVLGWLSGLALVQYQEAKEGLKELMALMARLENE
jgi:hypothetical protein